MSSKHYFTREAYEKAWAKRRKYYNGEYNSPEYTAWANMITRCYNPKYNEFHRYGGRGIKVCERWLNDFNNFLEDMGPRPDLGCRVSLDRIDPDGDYCPENCRWATQKQQMRNYSCNRWLTDSDGETLCIKDMAAKHGIKRTTLQMRLDVYGWSLDDALSIEVKKGGK